MERTGVRRAVVATPARAARTSSAVTGEDSTVATSVRLSLRRGTPRSMQALGTADTLLPNVATLAEGPRWDTRTQRLLWVDIDGRALHEYDPETDRDRAIPLPAKVGVGGADRGPGPRPRRARRPARDASTLETGDLEPLAEFPHARADMRANDGDVDPAGRFWIGTHVRGRGARPRRALPLRPGRHPDPRPRARLPLQRPRLGRRRAAHVLHRLAHEAGRRARLRRRHRRGRRPPAVRPHRGRRRRPRRPRARRRGRRLGRPLRRRPGPPLRARRLARRRDRDPGRQRDRVRVRRRGRAAAVHHHRALARSRSAAACSPPTPGSPARRPGRSRARQAGTRRRYDHDHRASAPATSASPPRRDCTAPTR